MTPLERAADKAIRTIFRLWPQPQPPDETLKAARLVAHRGVHESELAIENTLASFRLAVQHGIWGVEFDVRFTADDVPIVLHDPDCGRVFQRPDIRVGEISFAKLRAEVPNVPSLAEAISELSHRVHMMIEIKEDLRGHSQRTQNLATALERLKPVEDYHFLSLEPTFLEALTFAPKSSYMDVIWLQRSRIMEQNARLEHGALAGHFLHFSRSDLVRLKTQNKTVGVGFLDSKNSLFRELHRGVDFIFTNHPLKLKSYILYPS